MIHHRAWEALGRADEAYGATRDAVLRDEPVGRLREAFASGSGDRLALRFLGYIAPTRPDIVQELIPELFDYCLGMDPYATRARYLLAGLRPDQRDSRLEPLVSARVADPDPESDTELRALAMTLEQIGRLDWLERLKDAVRDSPSEDLRGIAEDFPEFS
ncbi:hypothetical protein [Kibdelosporangium phytohabitans]|nr:hypothetical protein [Kibdelosporangium phytohabitans]MBE1470563.1 hypothetical protein [Kibdelosporangium phytohabitans]